ncbi:hypothetical protein LC593_10900 [Nostoc sp. CHAB 5844]|nr:hypothetical protein [Nostoc sp. CHAB 5844]
MSNSKAVKFYFTCTLSFERTIDLVNIGNRKILSYDQYVNAYQEIEKELKDKYPHLYFYLDMEATGGIDD